MQDSQAAVQEQGTLPDSTRFLGRSNYHDEPEEKTGDPLILALVHELRRTSNLFERLFHCKSADRAFVGRVAVANQQAKNVLSSDDESALRGAFLILNDLH